MLRLRGRLPLLTLLVVPQVAGHDSPPAGLEEDLGFLRERLAGEVVRRGGGGKEEEEEVHSD
jgi:hypothetical protein